jgi:hypothetical protein
MYSLEIDRKLITPTIAGYQQLLIQELKYSTELFELIRQLFFPNFSERELFDRYEKLDIFSFNHYKYIEDRKYCSFEDLDKINYGFQYINPDYNDRYKFFDKQDFSSIEEANGNYRGGFFFSKRKFEKIYDEFLLGHLTGFKRHGRSSVYLKHLGDEITMVLNLKRDEGFFHGLSTYVFPDLSFRVAGKEYRVINRNDIKTLLFLPIPAFLFFYMNSNEQFYNENGQIIRVLQKTGEPLIYHDEQTGIFTISNSYKNLDRFNKYLYFIAELYIHYYNFFETWFAGQIRRNMGLFK